MSVAEIRPYQPGDTIKQIDRMSTAKKSELMTKLTHQEEQLSIVHIIPQVQSLPQSLLLKTLASLSYAGLKYGDVVGTLLGKERFSPSRGREELTRWLEKVKQREGDEVSVVSSLTSRVITKSVCCLYLADFPTDDAWKHIKQLSQKNTVILILLAQQEMIEPVSGKSYGYDSYDLLSLDHEAYTEVLNETIQSVRSTMQSVGGKFMMIDTGSDPLVQLTKQWIF